MLAHVSKTHGILGRQLQGRTVVVTPHTVWLDRNGQSESLEIHLRAQRGDPNRSLAHIRYRNHRGPHCEVYHRYHEGWCSYRGTIESELRFDRAWCDSTLYTGIVAPLYSLRLHTQARVTSEFQCTGGNTHTRTNFPGERPAGDHEASFRCNDYPQWGKRSALNLGHRGENRISSFAVNSSWGQY